MSKSFNLISLGYRGVGKTVFLAGSSAALVSSGQQTAKTQNLWFNCRDQEARSNLEKLVSYITRTGQYPPPTLKVTDFSFTLHRKRFGFQQTLCQFNWLDIPGETCDTSNREFQSLLSRSHGCCVFIDAEALLRDPSYSVILERLMLQVEAIAALAQQHNLKYPLALICTKCDLLVSGAIGLVQIEERLKPLTAKLDAVKAHYRQFYSSVPIVAKGGKAFLEPKGASTPVLWLVSELNKIHSFNKQPDLGSALEGLVNDKPISSLATPSPGVFDLSQPKGLLFGTLAGCGGLAAIAALVLGVGTQKPDLANSTPKQRLNHYESIIQKEPTNIEALKQLGIAYSDLQQHEQAIQSFEKVLQQEPNDLQALDGLALLYGLTKRKPQQEEMYDRILKITPDNLIALTEKAGLLFDKGDRKGAEKLFQQAEDVSPDAKLKQTVREIADRKLNNSAKPASDAKP
jgi:tetratricopeptide (TPR) repeat protein